METGIEETRNNIKAIGLYEPDLQEKLIRYHEDPVNSLELTIHKAFLGQLIRFEVYVSTDYNKRRTNQTNWI